MTQYGSAPPGTWPSAPFCPAHFRSEDNLQPFVSDIILLEKPNKYLEVGNYKKSLIGSDKFISPIMALRACSDEPRTVNYPGVTIAPGQALPRVHMMVCCPGATLPRVNFIAPGQVHRHLITTNLFEFL